VRRRLPHAALVASGLLGFACAGVRADEAPPQPPAIFRALFDSVPPVVLHVAAAGSGARVFLFYDQGPMLPSLPDEDSAAKRKSFVQSWNGSAWDEPRPFARVYETLNVNGEIWALTDGGYLASKDGGAWSPLAPKPEWKEPFGCVAAGRPHVFYASGGKLMETVFDGNTWDVPRAAADDWSEDGNASPFRPGPQAVFASGRIRILRLETSGRRSELVEIVDENGRLGEKTPLGPAISFRALEAPDGLHLFYSDPTPPQISSPSVSKVFSMMTEMQSRMLRTSHRVYDGAAWSVPEEILTGQALALAAARTDDGLWLFASGMNFVGYVVRRDGAWSSPRSVSARGLAWPAASGSSGSPKALALLYLAVVLPMTGFFGLIVWGISAAIESGKPAALDAPGGRVRCASLLRRAAAQVVDGLVLGAALMTLQYALAAALKTSMDPAALMVKAAGHFWTLWLTVMLTEGSIFLGYFVVCETLWGKTPGKRALKIRVVSADGSRCTWGAAAIRNVLRIFDCFGAYFVGALAFAVGARHQRLGDLAAGTFVVLDEK
jgi:uncharacterized RDD family membrane protein YckC